MGASELRCERKEDVCGLHCATGCTAVNLIRYLSRLFPRSAFICSNQRPLQFQWDIVGVIQNHY